MRNISEFLRESLEINEGVHAYKVFKGLDALNEILDPDEFNDLFVSIVNSAKKYGKPKATTTNLKWVLNSIKDSDIDLAKVKIYDQKAVEAIWADVDHDFDVFKEYGNFDELGDWFDPRVQLLQILFVIAGWIVNGLVDIDPDEIEFLGGIAERLDSIDLGEGSTLWDLATSIQANNFYKALR